MALYQGGVDPLIADVMMPTMDGFTMVKEMRAAGFEQPVLMLTAKTTITDKTTGFTSGADDYLTKPVDLAELKLRVAALLRRAKINSARQITIGQTILNEENFTLTINGHFTTLAKRSFCFSSPCFPTPIKFSPRPSYSTRSGELIRTQRKTPSKPTSQRFASYLRIVTT